MCRMSQFVTVIKDTSFLWSVLALQEILGKANILMGRYTATSQVFVLYGLLALIYFVVNFHNFTIATQGFSNR